MSHELQLNLDMVVQMPCDVLRVNIADASGDRILAGELLKKDDTSWKLWMDKRNLGTSDGPREYQTLSQEDSSRLSEQEADAHVHHVLGEVRRNPRKKFPKGPRMRWGEKADSCRIYGSLEGNKVQGDFHITARGHGYSEFAPHLDHGSTFLSLFSSLIRQSNQSTDKARLQLHAYDHGTLVWSSLPHDPQPTG